ncbi:MAG: ATP-binding cassette domain-containing protein [Candidatus Ornithospirochaeta sp.]|nr:ATP-binding cassette domain-containing protein [Candidatus Ornithospirochaeta sp.]
MRFFLTRGEGMLEIKDLSFSFSAEDGTLFSSFSLSAGKGEKILIIAPPGSGKSTLSRILAGTVPKYISGTLSGSASIEGIDLLSLDIPERMLLAGRASQNTDEMILFSSVEDELVFPLENLGLERSEIGRRLEDALALFSLSSYRHVSTTELSGGEKRRLMLAVLFAVDPALYILDESFDELSPEWRARLSAIIKESDRTFLVLGSHFLPEYRDLFDSIYSMTSTGLEPFRMPQMIEADLPMHAGGSLLEADGIAIKRKHRTSDAAPFTLSVPHFSLRQGECMILAGENGSGKSSFSRVLSGLLEEDKGSVLLDGRRLPSKERRSTVAYLMQNPFEQLFLPTVEDELASTGKSRERIDEALDIFGLDGSWYINEISYGKAKLVQAALFYLLDRPFAIFDEIDSAMSYSDSIRCVESYLRKGSGLLVITHDMAFASSLGADSVMIRDGVLCR